MEYIAFSMDTTSIGVMRLQISVNVTTSENNIETLPNICGGWTGKDQNKYKYYASMEHNTSYLVCCPRILNMDTALHLPHTYQWDSLPCVTYRPLVWVSSDIKVRPFSSSRRPTSASIPPTFCSSAAPGPAPVSTLRSVVYRPALNLYKTGLGT